MQIATFTRSTPDTAARVTVGADGAADQGEAGTVVNPWDEYALEECILRAAESGGQTTVIAIGPAFHEEALRTALAMGLDAALRIEAPTLDPADSLAWARLAAAALRRLEDARLLIFGRESVDIGTDQHQIQTARLLGWPMLGYVTRILELDEAAGFLRVERLLEQGRQVLRCPLPAAISVLKDINQPRYPSFMGIRRARRAQIPVLSPADLGVTLSEPRTRLLGLEEPPRREREVELLAGTPAEQATALLNRLQEEGVL